MNPLLDHPPPSLTFVDPIFDTDVYPNCSWLRRFVNVQVMMKITEDEGATARHSNRLIRASSD